MNFKVLIAFALSIQLCHGQQVNFRNDLIELAKVYHHYHFVANTPGGIGEQLKTITSPELMVAKAFITELCKTNNEITTKQFLSKPDSATLKSLYIIRGINHNMFEANGAASETILDSLQKENTDYNELLSCYYNLVFTSVANKNKPFNLSAYNFIPADYSLQNDTEKGIFFLETLDFCGTVIWGLMNIPKPPNYKSALENIEKYPTFSGQPYYEFTDLNFPDFKLTTDKRRPKESFKKYYINKYMSTLLYHCICLSQKKKNESKRTAVMLGSILHNESYWDYFSDRRVLEQIFQKVKE